jgi:hypothetical protein
MCTLFLPRLWSSGGAATPFLMSRSNFEALPPGSASQCLMRKLHNETPKRDRKRGRRRRGATEAALVK